jgi:hypothetical protein
LKRLLISACLLALSFNAMADGPTDCGNAAGSYLSGTVVSGPTYARASSYRQGIGLSHTHIQIQADQDGQYYDVAMDNVYANDFDPNSNTIPPSLGAIQMNDHVEMCGEMYSDGTGIHWVHSNCGVTPDATHPDGFAKELAADGTEGSNLESSQAYCYLFQ